MTDKLPTMKTRNTDAPEARAASVGPGAEAALRPGSSRVLARLALSAALALLVSACGQKGPLTLPKPAQPQPSAAPAAPAASAPAQPR